MDQYDLAYGANPDKGDEAKKQLEKSTEMSRSLSERKMPNNCTVDTQWR